MKQANLRLKQVNTSVCCTILNILETLINQAIAKSHQCSNSRILLRTGNHILAQESTLDPVGERMQPSHDTKGSKTIVKALNKTFNILSLFHKPKRSTKANFGNNVIGHKHSPRRKVERFVGRGEFSLQTGHPILNV